MHEIERERDIERGHGQGVERMPGYDRSFDSFFDYVSHVQNVDEIRRNYSDADQAHKSHFHGDVAGSEGLDASLDVAQSGWGDGASKMHDLIDEISSGLPTASRPRTEMVESRAGGRVSVPDYLSGRPQHMERPEQIGNTTSRGRTMTLMVNFTASSRVDADTLMRRGACIGATALILEEMGYPTEIIATQVSYNYGANVYFGEKIRIKRADGYLNESVLAFSLAHPCMLRRLHFRSLEGHEDPDVHDVSGYGKPADWTEQKADGYYKSPGNSDTDWDRLTDPTGWITDEVEDLTGQSIT